MLQFGFVFSHNTIVSYIFCTISCTTLQLWFVCSLFGLFCYSDTNTPCPFSTYGIRGSHGFLPPVTPQHPMVALPFRPIYLNHKSARTSLSPPGTPYQSILSNLPLHSRLPTITPPSLMHTNSLPNRTTTAPLIKTMETARILPQT